MYAVGFRDQHGIRRSSQMYDSHDEAEAAAAKVNAALTRPLAFVIDLREQRYVPLLVQPTLPRATRKAGNT